MAGWKAHTATVATLAFGPDGHVIASGSLDSGRPGHANLILWDAISHKKIASLEGHTNWVRSVAFSPDGRWLASARRRSDCADLERRGEDHRGRADWAHQESYVCRIQPRREDARDSIERRVGPALGRCHAASTGNLARYGKHAGGQVCARRLASGLGQ